MTKKKVSIEEGRFYSLKEIEELGLLTGVVPSVNHRFLRKLVEQKKLKAQVYGKGVGTRYYIKGASLLAFIESVS